MTKLSSIKLRRTATPYNVLCTLAVRAGNKFSTDNGMVGVDYCPLIQTYDNETQKYAIDRTEYPTVIVPQVTLINPDTSVAVRNSSANLTNIVWYIKPETKDATAVDITSSTFKNSAVITANGDEKGTLTFSANLNPEERYMVWFTAQFCDTRTGSTIVIDIKSEILHLATMINAESAYTMAIDRPSGEEYNIFYDTRLIYDYELANGIIDGSESYVDDGKGYLRTLTVDAYKGENKLTATKDYTIKIERLDGSEYTELSDANRDINSIGDNSITFDLRWNTIGTYRISIISGGETIASKYWGYQWNMDAPKISIISGSTYTEKDDTMTAKAQLTYNGSVIKYPELVCDIVWMVDSVQKGGGEQFLADTQSSEFTVTASVEKRGAFMIATDEGGNILTDEDGNTLVFN